VPVGEAVGPSRVDGASDPQRTPTRWRCRLARAALLGVLGLVATSLVLEAVHASARFREVSHRAQRIEASANQLLVDLLDAESGQRGFVITGDARFLQSYSDGAAAVPAQLSTLAGLTARQSSFAARVFALRELSAEKLSFEAATIELARSGRHALAVDAVDTGKGLGLMGLVRVQIAAIARDSTAMPEAARRAADRWLKLALTVDALLVALALAVSLRWRAASVQAVSQRDRAHAELLESERLERALGEIAIASAGGQLDGRAMARLVTARVAQLLGVPSASVLRFAGEDGRGVSVLGHYRPSRRPVSGPVGEGTRCSGAWTDRLRGVDEVAYVQQTYARFAAADDLDRAIAVPLHIERRLWGCLGVAGEGRGGLAQHTEDVLGRFAALLSTALAEVRARQRLRDEARLERALREVATASSAGELSQRELAELVCAHVSELLRSNATAVARIDGKRLTVLGYRGNASFPSHFSIDGPSVAARVARAGELAREDDCEALGGEMAALAAADGSSCVIGVPLFVGGVLWGSMTTATGRSEGFTGAEQRLLERVAQLASSALANAQAQERLRERALILGSLQEGLVVLDSAGRIAEVNDPLCAMTGYTRAQLLGTSAPYPFSAAGEEFALAKASGTAQRSLARADGSLLHVAASVVELSDADGGLPGRAAVFTDISETIFHSRLEHALGEIAAASAGGDYEASALFNLVSERVADLLDAAAAVVVRFDGGHGLQVGKHATVALPDEQLLNGPGAAPLVAKTGRPVRVEDYAEVQSVSAQTMVAAGLRCAVAVPIRVRGALWGCVRVLSERPGGLPAETEQLLERFAALVSVALASADTLATLQRQATTDGLTGLLNHRAFQESLEEQRRRAMRHGRPLALAMFDLDGFKAVNDVHGHQAGDRVLETVARTFLECKRAGDISARVGGDEFAVIAPDIDAEDARSLAERLRRAASDSLAALGLPVTLSAGVTDLGAATTMHDLFHLADSALYYAKHHGRDRTVRYAPGAGHELSEELRQRRFERARALTGLSALARAVDARDASTQQHAQRVATISEQLAQRLGWNPERCARLREAALLHDVGKIGVPDKILAKSERLSAAEYEQVKAHTLLGAQIAQEVLDEEQVRWLRSHHERPDGRGYPDALSAEEIPDGAKLLGLADAFDAMTSGRSYQAALSASAALQEMRAHADTQFDRTLLDVLEDWASDRVGEGGRNGSANGRRPARCT